MLYSWWPHVPDKVCSHPFLPPEEKNFMSGERDKRGPKTGQRRATLPQAVSAWGENLDKEIFGSIIMSTAANKKSAWEVGALVHTSKSAPRRLRQEDHRVQPSLGHITRPVPEEVKSSAQLGSVIKQLNLIQIIPYIWFHSIFLGYFLPYTHDPSK